MKVYLILDNFGWQSTLRGIFDSKKKAEIARDTVIHDFTVNLFEHAEKQIAEGISRYEQWVATDEYLGRIVDRKRADWFDYTPERYIKDFIVIIAEAEFNKIIDLNIYAE